MPMFPDFKKRLFPHLSAIVKRFGTPFHIYDAAGIKETGEHLKRAFADLPGFREYYAVKALPNPAVLELMLGMGFGFDCSSTMELELCSSLKGIRGDDIMFTSNNTTQDEFRAAQKCDAIINLDDISLVSKVPDPFPKLVCFRYNPGATRTGNSIIGKPEEAKYGITHAQLIPAYRMARERGAERFGIHTMVCSNELKHEYMIDTVRMLLVLCVELEEQLGIQCEFMNMGGGIGIPYRPEQKPFELELMAEAVISHMREFESRRGWMPKLYMESGRYMTGPHGVLVTSVINRKEIYETHVGVDAGMPALMRYAMYGAYHHIDVLNGDDRPHEVVNVVGSICENCDRLAGGRGLPVTKEGDILIVHDTGAHGIAMGFNYNGRLRPKELMLWKGSMVTQIRRAETNADLWRTIREGTEGRPFSLI